LLKDGVGVDIAAHTEDETLNEKLGKHSIQSARIAGMRQMHTLAAAAVAALETANLVEEAHQLHSRVLSRSPEALVEVLMVAEGVCRWDFKPIVELLLHEIRDAATASDLSIDERRTRIRWALEVSGF
jgi:hypothetical protein